MNYKDNNYALNKYSEGIVYRFADEIITIAQESYLAENPGKTEKDFRALKELSDAIYLEQDRDETTQTKKNITFGELECSALCSVQSPEEFFMSAIDAREKAERRRQRLAITKHALERLTDTQRKRYLLHEEIEHTSTTTDADGNTETDTWYEYILHITVTGKTAAEMAEQYGFNTNQKAQLEELLRPEYDSLWIALLAGVSSNGVTGTISLGVYIWPSANSNYVTSFFGTRVHPISGVVHHHNGIDIGAAYGTAVLAADGGTVTLAGWNGGYGNCVIIDHGNGNKTLYAHMSQLNVSAGQTVTQGQTIGLIGSTGDSTGPHLHFETYVNGSRVDPLLYFDNYTAAW